MRGMILAAGYGTRLWPLTLDRAKPAVPFLNRPLISYSIDYLHSVGINEIVINLHHEADSVRRAVNQSAISHLTIHFSLETEILGTGGALDKVRPLLQDDTVVVINGKIITAIELASVIQTHRQRAGLATLVLRPNDRWERFSAVEVDGSGRVVKFAGFPTKPNNPDDPVRENPPLMFTGIQVLEPGIFDYIPSGRFSHTTIDAYPQAIQEGKSVIAHVTTEEWHEMSTLRRYLEAHLLFLRRQGRSFINGSDPIIESSARMTDSVLWNDIHLGADASLHRCIVGDGVRIPAKARFEEVAIVRADLCPEPQRGEIIGENLVVPLQPISQPD